MDILLAALLLLCGDVSAASPDATYDQLAQASIATQNAIIAQQQDSSGYPNAGLADSIDEATGELVKVDPAPDTPTVRGVYATAHSAGGARLNDLVKLLNETELNSLVIDVKDDWGYVTWLTENEAIQALGTEKKIITDMDKLMTTLQDNDIYPIARIVVFKDSVLAKKKPE